MTLTAPGQGGSERLFFSYGHDHNTAIVERLRSDLEAVGYSVWIDTSRIKAGAHWRRKITDGVLDSDAVVGFLSAHSVRNPGVCRDELTIALATRDTPLITVLLEPERDVQAPSILTAIQWLDMSEWRTMQAGSDFDDWYSQRRDELFAALRNPDVVRFRGEVESLRKQLQPTETASKHVGLITESTLERGWIREAIESWRQGPNQTLLITGSPGTGKSVVAATELAFSPFASCAVFCEWNKHGWSEGPALVRNLAFNLATKELAYRRLLLDALSRQSSLADLTTDDLFDLLLTGPLGACIDGGHETIFVIVDALDEASPGTGSFLLALAKRHQYWPRWVKLLATSRPSGSLNSLFVQASVLNLDVDPRAAVDVADYVRIESERRGVGRQLQKIATTAQTNFAFAGLALRLNEESGFDSRTMISGLGGLYEEAMVRGFDDNTRSEPAWRRVLEVILADGTISAEGVRLATGLSRYELHEVVTGLGSLLRYRAQPLTDPLTVFHKSFADWITDPDQAGGWFVDVDSASIRRRSFVGDRFRISMMGRSAIPRVGVG